MIVNTRADYVGIENLRQIWTSLFVYDKQSSRSSVDGDGRLDNERVRTTDTPRVLEERR
jgi:hypothetical protein